MGQSIGPEQVHVDQVLQNISIKYSNPEYIAERIFPIVPVGKLSDKYYVYNMPEWFRDEAGLRAPGAVGRYGQWGTGTATYACQEYNFSALLPDEVRENSDAGLDPEATSVEYATDKVLLNMERRVATLVQTAGNWGTSGAPTYQWSDYDNSDPASDVKTKRQAVRSLTGRKPNTMVISDPVFEALKIHPLIVERLPVNVPQFVDENFLARVFEVQRLLVGQAIYTATVENQAGTATYTDVWSDNVWLGYVAPRPELRMPSAGYVFQHGPRRIERHRADPRAHTDIFECRMNQDEKIVSTICGAVLTDVLA
jgi:hypothetical protein